MRESQNINNEEVLKLTVDGLFSREVVFVFGAGASLSSGIAGGNFLKEKLESYFKPLKKIQKVMDIYKKEYQAIPDNFRGKDFDETISKLPLEYLISFGCKFHDEKTMIDWLKRYIPDVYKSKIRYFPLIAYEFVSHLMNNTLIQYVVTLNYDELLDKTIADELGEGKCYRIATIEDFEKLGREQDWERISQFFIFKPHGTISLSMSLIHQYQRALKFEEEKAVVLEKLFKNKILVLVGYEANDEDFRLLLSKQLLLGNIKKVFVVKGNPERVLEKLPHSEDVLGYKGRGEFFEELAERLHEDTRYKENYTKATRHFIRCKIYQKLSPGDPSSTSKYNLKRKGLEKAAEEDPLFFTRLNLLLEILIFCFKSRGLFANTALMSCNRIISALKEHLKEGEVKGERAEVKEVLNQLANPRNGILKERPIEKRLESYWYYLPVPKKLVNIEINDERIKELYKEKARKALEMLNSVYLSEIQNPLEKDEIDYLAEEFYELQRDFDYDMSEQYIPYFLFRKPIPLKKDREEFHKKTKKILAPKTKKAGSILYIISLTGEWLKRVKIGSNIKKVKVITDSEIEIKDSLHYKNVCFFQKRFLSEIHGKITPEFRKVNGINHRITLQFKKKQNKIEGEAIYFYRPGKGSSFAPFYLKKSEDIIVLKVFFDKLWRKISKRKHDYKEAANGV